MQIHRLAYRLLVVGCTSGACSNPNPSRPDLGVPGGDASPLADLAALADLGPPPTDGAVPSGASVVTVSGYQLLVRRRLPDGSLAQATPYDLKGISWSPYGVGDAFDGSGRNFSRFAAVDLPLMQAAHINTVKTYTAFERNAAGLAVLDELFRRGMMVAMTVFAGYDDNQQMAAVTAFKDHPAVLYWIVGNEWNYNRLYSNHTFDECVTRVNQVITAIKALDANHPVATVYGELPTATDYARIGTPDLWGLNLYPNVDFADRFTRWKAQSPKPCFISEYGADAYFHIDAGNPGAPGHEDQDSQAYALDALTRQLRGNLSAQDPAKVCLGGTPFAWNDEWWKSGNPSQHDTDGFSGAIYMDRHATEEWWGLVDAQRTPRKAYTTLQSLYP